MKFTRILSLLTIASLFIFFSNCGSDGGGGSSKEKVQLGKLKKTWNIIEADLNGDDRIDDFTNFELTISGNFNSSSPEGPYNYSVDGERPYPSPWPGPDLGSDGTWEFVSFESGNEGDILRDGEIPMHYIINSDGQLILTVICEGCNFQGASRTAQVDGEWTFTFN